MKKLVLILCLFVNVGFGNDFQQILNQICGSVELSQCIKHYKNRCDSGNVIDCGATGNLFYYKQDLYEARRYYQMVCEKIDLGKQYETQTAYLKKFQGNFEDTRRVKATSCYNFVIVTKDLILAGKISLSQAEEKYLINALKTACNLGHSGACAGIERAKQIARQRGGR